LSDYYTRRLADAKRTEKIRQVALVQELRDQLMQLRRKITDLEREATTLRSQKQTQHNEFLNAEGKYLALKEKKIVAVCDLKLLASHQSDRSNEHPSMHGRSRPEDQTAWEIAEALDTDNG
jgi:TolA-binding protein